MTRAKSQTQNSQWKKGAGGVAQGLELLPTKCLSSNPSIVKKIKVLIPEK
jgi:hypothetical protein